MRRYMIGLAIAAGLVVPSTASASSQEGCRTDPDVVYVSADCYQTQTVEEDDAADEDTSEQDRQAAAKRERAGKLRCKSVVTVKIWKSRPDISCAMARQLAGLRSGTASYKGWRRSFYESGYWSYRLEERVDQYGEVHVYRVPTDWYMQADWRKGKAKVTLAGGVCESKDCVLDPRRGN